MNEWMKKLYILFIQEKWIKTILTYYFCFSNHLMFEVYSYIGRRFTNLTSKKHIIYSNRITKKKGETLNINRT